MCLLHNMSPKTETQQIKLNIQNFPRKQKKTQKLLMSKKSKK